MALLWRVSAEPVLCFDGDGAGQRAAYRAIERALPLLKPERSFKFVTLSDGMDPDDMLREKGAGALRDALIHGVPFVKMLFQRELAESGPLDTPEAEAGLKVRLRKAAAIIADPDLARTYKDYLIAAFYQHLRPSKEEVKRANWTRNRHDRARRHEAVLDMTPEARAAVQVLSLAPRPLIAAVVDGLIDNPELVHEQAEMLSNQGIGDAGLDRLVADLVRLSFEAEALAEGLLRSRLKAMGHEETLQRIDRVSPIAHAPFQNASIPLEQVRASLLKAMAVIMETLALDRALNEMKNEEDFDVVAFSNLKAQRDAMRRLLGGGALWEAGGTAH